jgi:hypothetical protein
MANNTVEKELLVKVLFKIGRDLAEYLITKDDTFAAKGDKEKIGTILSFFVGSVVDILDMEQIAEQVMDEMKKQMDLSKDKPKEGGGQA